MDKTDFFSKLFFECLDSAALTGYFRIFCTSILLCGQQYLEWLGLWDNIIFVYWYYESTKHPKTVCPRMRWTRTGSYVYVYRHMSHTHTTHTLIYIYGLWSTQYEKKSSGKGLRKKKDHRPVRALTDWSYDGASCAGDTVRDAIFAATERNTRDRRKCAMLCYVLTAETEKKRKTKEEEKTDFTASAVDRSKMRAYRIVYLVTLIYHCA